MKTQTAFPRIASFEPLPQKRLLVEFANGAVKIYDCAPLLERDPFAALRDEALFRQVQVEPHGYAVIWNDDIDLAESELWLHGESDKTEDHAQIN